MFCEYITDPRYPWLSECECVSVLCSGRRTHHKDTHWHVSEYEGDAARRPLTFDEVQALFDAADGLAARIRSRRRKGASGHNRWWRLLKCVYAFGSLTTRDGDAGSRGPAPQRSCGMDRRALSCAMARRSRRWAVKNAHRATVPEMEWIAETLTHYLE